jgi:cytochrome P450
MRQASPASSKKSVLRRDPGGAPSFDFTHSPSRPDAHEFFARAREASPVCFDAASGEWIVLGYEAAVWCFKHPEILSSKCHADFDPLVVGNDPPEHTLYRKILGRAMVGCDAAMVEAYTSEWMAGFIKRRERSGGIYDAVSNLACPLPESFAGVMLGLDVDETDYLSSIRQRNSTQLHLSHPSTTKYLEELIARARLTERGGVLGALLSISGPDKLSDTELVGLLRLLWFAGTSTSTHFLPSLILLMLKNPGIMAQMRAGKLSMSSFVNEALRMEGPVAVIPRKAVTDFECMGVKIPAEAVVKICILAANNDPAVFPEPTEIRYNRPTASVAFGHGIHFCLGAMIAKAMAAKVAEILTTRCPEMKLAVPHAKPVYERSQSFRSLLKLDITAI